MNIWQVAALFIGGYLTSHYDLISKTRSTISDLPTATHKQAVLYALITLTLIFIVIAIPLERLARPESAKYASHPLRTSAREHLKRRGSF